MIRLTGWWSRFTDWMLDYLKREKPIMSIVGLFFLTFIGLFVAYLSVPDSLMEYMSFLGMWEIGILQVFVFSVIVALGVLLVIPLFFYIFLFLWWLVCLVFKPWICAARYETVWESLMSDKGFEKPDTNARIEPKELSIPKEFKDRWKEVLLKDGN